MLITQELQVPACTSEEPGFHNDNVSKRPVVGVVSVRPSLVEGCERGEWSSLELDVNSYLT